MCVAITVNYTAFAAFAQPVLSERSPDFTRDIQPIFHAKCVKCHGPHEQNGGLRLDSAEAAIEGGDRGPSISTTDVSQSILLQAVMRVGVAPAMPPEDENTIVNEREIALIRNWLTNSATASPAEKVYARVKERRFSDHWAFQPIQRSTLPSLNDTSRLAGNEIDAFIAKQLQEIGAVPSPPADRVTLIRRVSLDLVGLPPTIDEVAGFVEDERPEAYELLVNRLLGSPHFGERWGRWWLDQARYADSDGYSNDEARVMWKYRDWVINAFNEDLPFDEFIIQQLAGDLLPKPGLKELVATGFHRNTQTYSEGDSAAEEYRVENVVDRVDTTGVVFMGLTLGCARCHNHKFDPVSQNEFFQLFAFFNNQDEPKIDVPTRGWDAEDDATTTKDDITTSLVMREREEPRATHIHIRGDYLSPGRQVAPGVPAVLPPLASNARRPTRLDLAKWLVAPEHPLTTRVITNRVWQVFFGKGIVETDDDFGTQGSKPTHPELLDWLANDFQRQKWSMKSLVRSIVMSATYRQSSNFRADTYSHDPRNVLLARQNRLRLDAELVRDAALRASGLLSAKIGGPSVFPPQPGAAMRMTQHLNREWKVSAGEDRYRRGLYTFIWRLAQHPLLASFNAPEGSVACTRRARANTPLQSLMLLNDEAFVEAAQALALRALNRDEKGDEDRLEYVFRRCLARPPESNEVRILLDLLNKERRAESGSDKLAYYPAVFSAQNKIPAKEFAAWISVSRTLLNLDEFITRE